MSASVGAGAAGVGDGGGGEASLAVALGEAAFCASEATEIALAGDLGGTLGDNIARAGPAALDPDATFSSCTDNPLGLFDLFLDGVDDRKGDPRAGESILAGLAFIGDGESIWAALTERG